MHIIIHSAVCLRQVHNVFQSEFSTDCDLVLPLSVYSILCFLFWGHLLAQWRPGSSVGIATDYGLDGPGIESRWGRDFTPVQTGPGAHPASCTMGTGSFPGVKCGRGVLLTTHPLLAPKSWKGGAIPLPPLWATIRPVTGLLYFTLDCFHGLHESFIQGLHFCDCCEVGGKWCQHDSLELK